MFDNIQSYKIYFKMLNFPIYLHLKLLLVFSVYLK